MFTYLLKSFDKNRNTSNDIAIFVLTSFNYIKIKQQSIEKQSRDVFLIKEYFQFFIAINLTWSQPVRINSFFMILLTRVIIEAKFDNFVNLNVLHIVQYDQSIVNFNSLYSFALFQYVRAKHKCLEIFKIPVICKTIILLV